MLENKAPKHIVLYADDDIDDVTLVKESLQGYSNKIEVIDFPNGFDALSYLEHLKYDDPAPCLIILDINMPKINGKDVLRLIRKMDRFAETPVILFSTSSMPTDQFFAQQNKAGFITKPLDIHQMSVIADVFIEHCSDDVKTSIGGRKSQN